MSNPFLNENYLKPYIFIIDDFNSMTLKGTVNKSIFLFIFVLLGSCITWGITFSKNLIFYISTLSILNLIIWYIIILKPKTSKYLAPIYSLFEGGILGFLSSIIQNDYFYLPLEAILSTFISFIVVLFFYRIGIIKVTKKFYSVIFGFTLSIFFYYFIIWLINFTFKVNNFFIFSKISIIFNLFIIITAILNLIIDFDYIKNKLENRSPKYMEWFSAVALINTLIWLYIEILSFLLRIKKRKEEII